MFINNRTITRRGQHFTHARIHMYTTIYIDTLTRIGIQIEKRYRTCTQRDAITGHWASVAEEHLNELNYKRIIGFEVKCIFSDCNSNENENVLLDFHNCFDFGNVLALSCARKADYDKKSRTKRAR